jgi:hypothetical protein
MKPAWQQMSAALLLATSKLESPYTNGASTACLLLLKSCRNLLSRSYRLTGCRLAGCRLAGCRLQVSRLQVSRLQVSRLQVSRLQVIFPNLQRSTFNVQPSTFNLQPFQAGGLSGDNVSDGSSCAKTSVVCITKGRQPPNNPR